MGMRASLRNAKPSGWPFWLLLAAWFCANSPQAATYSLIVWAHGARHFSHQERLKADVAFILAGRQPASAPISVASATARPFSPPVPAEAVLKKLDLSAPVAVEAVAPASRGPEYRDPPVRVPYGARLEPLLTPPRGESFA